MKTFYSLLLLLLTLVPALGSSAQDKPRWAIKGVSDINGKRSNDSYRFVKFETFGGDLSQLRSEGTLPLVEYIASTNGLDADRAKVELVTPASDIHTPAPNDSEGSAATARDYRIVFAGSPDHVFHARLIDEYSSFDENVDMTYDYTLYQLYAVSTAEGQTPVYDDCSFTRSYNGGALALSLVPGLGQWYKGQKTKSYCIWGGEVLFIGAAILCDARSRHFLDLRNEAFNDGNTISESSYQSKHHSWRAFRNIAIAGAVGVYIYNLADALFSKGPRQVVVSRPSGVSLAMQPTVVYDPTATVSPAIGLTLTF